MSSHVTLYVNSGKANVRNVQVGQETGAVFSGGWGAGTAYRGAGGRVIPYTVHNVETRTDYDYGLPEEQQRMVEDVQQLASRYGFTVEVVDLARKNAFGRFRLEHREKIKTLPALVTDSGEVSEGIMTREQIEAFLSKTAKTSRRAVN